MALVIHRLPNADICLHDEVVNLDVPRPYKPCAKRENKCLVITCPWVVGLVGKEGFASTKSIYLMLTLVLLAVHTAFYAGRNVIHAFAKKLRR